MGAGGCLPISSSYLTPIECAWNQGTFSLPAGLRGALTLNKSVSGSLRILSILKPFFSQLI